MNNPNESTPKTPIETLSSWADQIDTSQEGLMTVDHSKHTGLILYKQIVGDLTLSENMGTPLVADSRMVLEELPYCVPGTTGNAIKLAFLDENNTPVPITQRHNSLFFTSDGEIVGFLPEEGGMYFLSEDDEVEVRNIFDKALTDRGVSLG